MHYTRNIPKPTNRNLAVAFLLMATAMGNSIDLGKQREMATAMDAYDLTM